MMYIHNGMVLYEQRNRIFESNRYTLFRDVANLENVIHK